MSSPGATPSRSESSGSDEAALVEGLRRGDEDAFERLVRDHGPRLLAVTRRILGNDADAQDALQDAMISAYKSIDRFQAQSRLGTWLHRVAINAALQKLRRRRSRPEASIQDLLPKYDDSGHRVEITPTWTSTGDELLERDETRRLVRERILELPEDYRDVVLLRDIEGLETQEAASVLSISPGAVKTRLHRARQALRTLLEQDLA
ncbi:MAG: RNA polymerase sigma factor [Planctomycetota bacterium]|jgi:RNA polymerase sigma-70 factor (ECF subfamily)